jgi:hypothetical protein
MDVEILLHGVPSGQDYYGIKEEQKLAESFYTSSNESVKLVVEAKKNGTTPYVYYTYLRYKNIVGAGGRSGSYIGITLRLDMYYLDVVHMYNMLDIAFKKYIIGALLTPTGESYKYVSPDFSSKKLEIEQLQQGVLKLIETTCVFPKFVKIDNSFINQITNAPTCNIADITEGTMSATIKKYSKIILSPDYKSNLEKEYDKKLLEAEELGGSIVAEKDKKLVERDQTIAKLNSTISSRETDISTLKQEIKRRDLELSQHKQKGDLSQLIDKVKEPIKTLSEYFNVKDSNQRQSTPKFGKKNFYVGVINTSLLILMLSSIFIFNLIEIPKYDPNSKESESLKEQINKLESTINERDKVIAELRSELEVLNASNDSKASVSTKQKELRIDVEGYKNGKLSVDKEYKITIKDGNAVYSSKGTWNIKNAEIVGGKKTDATIRIKPTGNGQVELNYNIQDNNYKMHKSHSPRILQVEQKIEFKIIMKPNEKEVEVGKEYSFSIEGYNGEGLWKMDGFELSNGDKNASHIVVKATIKREGDAIISYTPSGRDDSKIKLTYKYKKDE